MDLIITGLQIPECRKLRQFITDYYPHLDHAVRTGHKENHQIDLALENHKEEKPLHTYYCLFLPLGIYCGFGAENIYHAYNKAAKHWGRKNPITYGEEPLIAEKGRFTKEHRIMVFNNTNNMNISNREVSHTLMTKLVKAWREENN